MLRLFVFLLLTFGISCFLSVAFGASAQAVPIEQWTGIVAFFRDNWAVVGLVLSELAAFLPPKYNGIIQGALNLLSAILKKKAKKS